jgi:hypothetical protein
VASEIISEIKAVAPPFSRILREGGDFDLLSVRKAASNKTGYPQNHSDILRDTMPAMKPCILLIFLSAILTAQSPQAVEITAEPHHHLVLQNDQIRVFYVEIPPQESTLEHWHRHDYVYISIGSAQIVNTIKGKDPVPGKLADGEAGLAPGNFEHIVRNVSSQPFRNVDVELLQDEKLRTAAQAGKIHWDDERSLDILHGGAGTREILWVKDGIRATEYELQPGGMMPRPDHARPTLLIALSDLFLWADRPKNAPRSLVDQIDVKPGAIYWMMPIHLSVGWTNNGHETARFIILEFPQSKSK